MSSSVTPRYGGGQSVYTPSTGYVSWGSKLVTANYATPMTFEFWVYPATALSASNNITFGCEAASGSLPSVQNGDWVFFFLGTGGGFGFYRWPGSGGNPYWSGYLGGASLSASWHHLFAQVNSSSSFTIGIDGTCYNATTSQLANRPNNSGYYVGSDDNVVGSASVAAYFQEVRLTDGIARYPASGTYTVPVRQFG